MTTEEKVHQFNRAAIRLRMLEEELDLYFVAGGYAPSINVYTRGRVKGDIGDYIGSISEFGGVQIARELIANDICTR